MEIESSVIETGVDKLVNIVKERGRIALADAAKELGVSATVIQEWANFLAEDGTISIKFKSAKPYLIDRKLFDKESSSIFAKAYEEFIDFIAEQITEESLKNDFNSAFMAFKRKKINPESEMDYLLNSYSKFLGPLVEKIKNEMGHEQTENIFENAYNKIKEKYGNDPAIEQILNTVPRSILEVEKFNMLTNEEIKKVAKELKRIEMMKSDFTNIAAHELRTPLVPIMGFLERLLKDPGKFKLTNEVQENLEICLRNAKKLNKLVEDILSISKLESGAMKFYMKTMDVRRIARNVRADFLESAKRKKLDLNIKLPPKLPKVEGDEQMITQVLSNLVQNAIKFTDRGSITISAVQKGDKVLFQVKDHGIGIDKNEIPRLFGKYYQIIASARKQMGTGLGLAICKEIVQKHNGSIWLESELGKGSSFYFTLPVKNNRK